MRTTTLVIYLLAAMVGGCRGTGTNAPDRSAALAAFIHSHRPLTNMQDLRGVVLITENGCVSCNRAFASLVEQHLNDQHLLFIISAIGQQVDLTTFRGHTDGIIWDPNESFRRTNILDRSGFILLEQGAIDTVLKLDVTRIETQLTQFSDLLSE